MFKETIGPGLTTLFWTVVAVVVLSGIGFGVRYVLAPANTALDNRVFHESQQYNDGMSRDLDNIRQEYLAASTTPEAKAALRATAMHRFANYDASRLPADQQAFLRQLRGY